MTRIHALISLLALAAVPLASGCDTIECGPGTVESDGECAPADAIAEDKSPCGPGTVRDPNTLLCVPEQTPAEICGGEGNVQANPDGTFTCLGGTGGARACNEVDPDCPSPSTPGRVSICGRIYDTESGDELWTDPSDPSRNATCDPANATETGPCSLKVEAYDPLAFAADPVGTPPLQGDLSWDECGRFKAINVARPFNGFVAIATQDNLTGANATADYRTTGVATAIAADAKRTGFSSRATRIASDEAWTASAMLSGGTFAEQGVYLAVFTDNGVPVQGVTVTAGGAVRADADYYFDDTDPSTISSVDPDQSTTGPNGAALLTGSSLQNHSGTGGERPGCEWPQNELAASIPGVVFFQEKHLLADGTADDCPQ